MKDSKLPYDHSCHALYSKPCKKQIQTQITLSDGRTGKVVGAGTAAICYIYPFTCGERDESLKEHPEYVDEQGWKRNK